MAMIEVNGVQVYENGDEVPMPRGVANEMSGLSLYGYLLVDGPSGRMWVDATEEDFRRSQSLALNIDPSAVTLPKYGDCTGEFPSCRGGCYSGSAPNCYAQVNPAGGHYYCGCHSKPDGWG